MFVIVEGLMLHVVCHPVLRCSKQRVKSFLVGNCTWIERLNISIDEYNRVDTIIS